ncbi:glycosyltransferase [Limosilactobacillus vaginalis]
MSIIIAVHNNERTLKKCIDSFYNKIKNNDKVEVICINDHSTDSSISRYCKAIQKNKNL